MVWKEIQLEKFLTIVLCKIACTWCITCPFLWMHIQGNVNRCKKLWLNCLVYIVGLLHHYLNIVTCNVVFIHLKENSWNGHALCCCLLLIVAYINLLFVLPFCLCDWFLFIQWMIYIFYNVQIIINVDKVHVSLFYARAIS